MHAYQILGAPRLSRIIAGYQLSNATARARVFIKPSRLIHGRVPLFVLFLFTSSLHHSHIDYTISPLCFSSF